MTCGPATARATTPATRRPLSVSRCRPPGSWKQEAPRGPQMAPPTTDHVTVGRARRRPPRSLAPLMLLLFGASALQQVSQVSGFVEKECRLNFFRLPRRVQPTNYKLFIKPNLSDFTFSAKLTIHLLVHQDAHDDALCALTSAPQAPPPPPPPPAPLAPSNRQQHIANAATQTVASQLGPSQQLKRRRKAKSKKSHRPSLACDRSKIILHAHRDLKISQLDFVTADGDPNADSGNGGGNDQQQRNSNQLIQVRDLCRDFKNELLVIGLNVELDHQTTAVLSLHYSGPIRNDKHGFFRSEYHDAQTQEPRHMAVTHFQAPHARKALPCFDEPNFKSNFNLVIEHARHLRALSNTQVIKEETVSYIDSKSARRRRREVANAAGAIPATGVGPEVGPEEGEGEEEAEEAEEYGERGEEFTRVHFAQTPRMSTYLLAFALGQFDHIETQVGKLKLAIYTPPGRAHLARYALNNAARAYGALRDYFQIDQPLEKIDFVAVRELDAGAMENWGLITFTEHFLLLDEHNTTPDDINYATDSVTHELSHQWFGNLVTMKWWDDLWLNEGFATWITQVINQQIYPDRDGELIYLMDALNAALNSDASRNTHPIRNVALQTVEEIEKSFDDITYEKASAVIRMLNDFMSPDAFKVGMQSYLATNMYQNTEALDLWTSLESSSKLNVRELMSSWIEQAGFPLLRARLSQDGRSLRVDQERFLERENATVAAAAAGQKFSGAKVGAAPPMPPPPSNQKWVVPLAMWISNGRERTKLYKVILSERSATIRLPHWFDARRQGHWLKLNANFGGFYRVSYDDLRLFRALRPAVEHKLMQPSDRLNLICDLFALLANEKLDMFQFDEALSWFQAEDNDAVLELLARYIASLEAHQYPSGWERTKLLVNYYLREGKFKPNKANSWLRLRTRANVASALVVIDNAGVTRDAIEQFEQLGGLGVPLSFRIPIFSAVARAGSAAQMARLISLVQRLESSHSQTRLVDAVTESIGGGGSAGGPNGTTSLEGKRK